MRSKQSANHSPTVHDVDDARREALLDQRSERQSTERSLLRRLVDKSVASSKSRRGFPGEQHSRHVPGANASADTDRLALDDLILALRIRIRNLTVNLVRQSGIVIEEVRADVVAHGLRPDSGAHSLGFESSKLAGLLTDQACELAHARSAVGGVHLGPFAALEGLLCRVDGGIDIFLARCVDLVR